MSTLVFKWHRNPTVVQSCWFDLLDSVPFPHSVAVLEWSSAKGVSGWDEAGGCGQEEPLLHVCGNRCRHCGRPCTGAFWQLGWYLWLLVRHQDAHALCEPHLVFRNHLTSAARECFHSSSQSRSFQLAFPLLLFHIDYWIKEQPSVFPILCGVTQWCLLWSNGNRLGVGLMFYLIVIRIDLGKETWDVSGLPCTCVYGGGASEKCWTKPSTQKLWGEWEWVLWRPVRSREKKCMPHTSETDCGEL